MSSSHNHGSKASNNAAAGDIDTTKAPTSHTHPTYALASDVSALTTRVASLEAWRATFAPPPTLDIDFAAGMDARLSPTYVVGDPGYGLDSDFLGNLSQCSVTGGILTIKAERKTTPSGRAYASASLGTKGTFSQKYGTFECRMRYSGGKGVWPALWLLAANSNQSPPEIDVLEAYPGDPGAIGGANFYSTALHYAGETVSDYFIADGGPTQTGGWHVYRMVWTATGLTFFLDGVQVGVLNNTAHLPTVAMYPIVTLAMGAPGARVDATTPATVTLDVDYVRVWA